MVLNTDVLHIIVISVLVWFGGRGGGNLRFFEAFKQAWKEGGLRVLPQEFFPRIYEFFLTSSDIDSDDAILDWNE